MYIMFNDEHIYAHMQCLVFLIYPQTAFKTRRYMTIGWVTCDNSARLIEGVMDEMSVCVIQDINKTADRMIGL